MTKARGKRGPDPQPVKQSAAEIRDMLARYLDGDTYASIAEDAGLRPDEIKIILDRGYFETNFAEPEARAQARKQANKEHWVNLMDRRRTGRV